MVRNQLDSVSHGESPRSGFRPTEKVVPVPGWSTGPRPCVASAHGGRRGGCAGCHDSGPPPASVGSDSPGREPAGHLIYPAGRFGIPRRADRVAANRRLNDPAESATRNVRVPPETEASDRPVKPGGRRSRHSSPRPGKPATRRRAAVRRETEAQVTECQRGGIVAMNVGEMQRLLSLKKDGARPTEGEPCAVKAASTVRRGESEDGPRGTASGSYPTPAATGCRCCRRRRPARRL